MHPACLCHQQRNWHGNSSTQWQSHNLQVLHQDSLSPYQKRKHKSTENSIIHNNHLTFSNFSTNVQLVCATSAGLTLLLNLGCRKLIPELPTLGDTAAVSSVLSPPNASCCSEVWSLLQWWVFRHCIMLRFWDLQHESTARVYSPSWEYKLVWQEKWAVGQQTE